MTTRPKDQILYIATSKESSLKNMFKVGGVKSIDLLKSKINAYNVDQPDDDKKMYCCFKIECYDFEHLQERVDGLIKLFKVKGTDFYFINFESLKKLIVFHENRYTEEVAFAHQLLLKYPTVSE